VLRECIADAGKEKASPVTIERLKELADFFETTTGWYEQIRQWPTTALAKFVRMGDKVRKLIGMGAD
jgi:hypothetical protein